MSSAVFEAIQNVDFAGIARTLRPGREPTINIPFNYKDIPAGGMNLHLPVEFDDGIKWAVRIKQQDEHNPAVALRGIVLRSEVETMKVLKRAGLKVPAVYGDTYSESTQFFTASIGSPSESIKD